MKKILISVSVIVAAGAIVVGATGAFFSDTETSTGNTFTAGAIDLGIDNESYYNGEFNAGTSWGLTFDLDDEGAPYLFFSFSDVKPGDWGEDTISVHVKDNDAWVCADVRLDSNEENDVTEPEDDLEDIGPVGELADNIDFIWWADDGDNVLEDDEDILLSGPLGALNVGQVGTVAIADSNGSIFASEDLASSGALIGATTYYVGKAWCFGGFGDGTLVPENRPRQDDVNDVRNPSQEGMGIDCDGAGENNISQTDSMTATVSFSAVQQRNNDEFVCTAHLEDQQE